MNRMNPSEVDSETQQTVGIKGAERWEIYWRLQQLGIPCKCATNQPLRAEVPSPTTAIQLWSVVRQTTASRRELVFWLHRCWQARGD
jgi:hypothetical protein